MEISKFNLEIFFLKSQPVQDSAGWVKNSKFSAVNVDPPPAGGIDLQQSDSDSQCG